MKRRDLLQGGAAALMLSPALAAAQGLPVLRECSVQQQGGLLRLRLELLGAQVAYRSFRLADPERLVIDLSGVSSQAPRIDPIPAGAAVTRIRSAAHLDGLRVVFDLQQPCSVNLRWEDSALVLELAPLSGGVALAASDAAPTP
ncbi:AMIN domain-containing protein, partial [Xanthomonas oryzae]